MELTFEQVQAYVETNKDTDSVKALISRLSSPTVDGVKGYLENTDEGKRLFQSLSDSKVTQGIETWKTNHLQTEIDKEIKKRFPEKDDKDIELENIKAQLKQMADEKHYESLKNKALTIVTEKKIPTSLVDLLLGKDEQTTLVNIGKLEEAINPYVQSQVDERLKNTYQPPGGGGNSFAGKNPWKKESFNLTEQAKILKENPELAKQLKAQA
jgi:hypothetical protein